MDVQSGRADVIAREFSILEWAVAVEDSGAVWFARVDRFELVHVDGATTTQWEMPQLGYIGLDSMQDRLYGVVVDDVDGPIGIGVAIIDTQGGAAANQMLHAADGAASVAAGDAGVVVVGARRAGEPASFTFIGLEGGPKVVTVADAQADRIGLSLVDKEWTVFFRQPSTGSIVSLRADGSPGPLLDAGIDPLAFSLTSDGRYAVGSFGGPPDTARLCFGRLVP